MIKSCLFYNFSDIGFMLTEGTEGKLPSCARREPCRDRKKREKRQRTQRTTMGGEAQGCDWWNQDLGPRNTLW